ncbi:ras-related protein rab-24 [Anaeramoeba flamelloides]|uniref:Ras-related protein rab-24 n=1 Tax=Anaeramoeba flamelloides TaxID=1746091 RepID=A0ABQ8YUX9_9EUKA|nr:ras-related protein rab-24 [Anaeramoeba flamelloides]
MSETTIDLKVLLLGNAYVGKSSLFDRFVNDSFSESQKATVGMAFGIKGIDIDEKRVFMGLWDTAGQEKFESITKMYYRNAKAAIVCYDITKQQTFDKIKFWISELKNEVPKCKIYLTGTKSDLIKEDESNRIPKKTIINFSKKLDIKTFETSAKKDKGVSELFKEIAQDHLQQIEEEGEEDSDYLDDLGDYQIKEPNRKSGGCC